ncbi:hypothetical protein LTR84_007997 [Exophiala bonariae]|uniref:Mitochondrial import inner membrane translocase subunit TIM50 n=1 Tax=Exophiala bonariae TaxID=1690606 RepID=A0AAV9NPD9_9EURO|nr:hypothetical protein LTR84_007997 [Exophiala bonariae]
MPRNRRRAGGRHEGNPSQNNPNIPQNHSLQGQPFYGPASITIYSDQPEQRHQGEYNGYYDYENEDRINIYKTVDSWRSYRNDGHSLQSSIMTQPYQILGSNPTRSAMNVNAPAFTPYQPLRLVHNYARYPSYRVDKPYRVSNGARERQAVHQIRDLHQAAVPRYSLRSQNRQSQHFIPATGASGQSLPHSRDQPIPSIESGFTQLAASNTLVPSSLPPKARRTWSPPKVTPPKRPAAASSYLKRAGQAPEVIDSPKKLLVILDLNGTLLVRPNTRTNPRAFKLRPGVTQLLDYLFANHTVMVYSSARPENVAIIVNNLFHPKQRAQLAGIWARDKLDLNQEQYLGKVQVYKKLDKIWSDKAIQKSAGRGNRWDQTNTVLVDDSRLKGVAQPHNLVQITEFLNNAPKVGDEAIRAWQMNEMAILQSLEQKLEQLKMQVDVSRLIREWQSGKRQAPGVVDETIDQKTQEKVEEQLIRKGSTVSTVTEAASESTPQPEQLTYPTPPTQQAPLSTKNQSKHPSALDLLDAQIDDAMKNTSLSDSSDLGSESPIDESVFSDLLRGGGTRIYQVKDMPKKSTVNVPPTTESLVG